MFIQTWLLPFLLLLLATVIAFPFSRYMAWIMNGNYQPFFLFAWIEKKLNTGAQHWKKYASSLLIFNALLFVFGFVILILQPYMPLNPTGKTLLAPSTIFHSALSFMTNTDLQHYIGEVHLSNFSQIFFCITLFFASAAVGCSALVAIIRALRGEETVGNFFVDMWRVVVYLFLPLALLLGIFFIIEGSPMTFESAYHITTLEKKLQTIVVGPVAAFEAIKMLGTNGGGFYGMNSAHPFENPTALSNFVTMLAMMIFPFSLVLMYGRMLNHKRHSIVLLVVMLLLMVSTISWAIYFDTLKPNPALTQHAAKIFNVPNHPIFIPSIAGLPVDQHLGNLEGKEMRFGVSAGATFTALTTAIACGAVNAEPDSLNPLAGLSPFLAMWLNCIFGGKGVGMINMLLYIIMGVFLAGMMVGRTPEYLGKKIGSREVKLTILALLVHPLLILLPAGLFTATQWGMGAVSNPGAHGLSQIIYQLSSASANNGSAFNGLNVIYGFYNHAHPAPEAIVWDIVTGLMMVFGRFLPMIAAMAMAAYLGAKRPSPFGLGTLRDDTFTFGLLLLGTIIIIGALLFLPVVVLGPLAEQVGPMPFGG